FLIHVLPKGFHRIRHYGLFAKASCADNIARARELLAVPKPQADADVGAPTPCPCCGGRMIIIETFAPSCQPHDQPSTTTVAITTDTPGPRFLVCAAPASSPPPAGPHPVAPPPAHLRRAAINASLQPPHSATVPTINPSCCCLPVAALLAPRH